MLPYDSVRIVRRRDSCKAGSQAVEALEVPHLSWHFSDLRRPMPLASNVLRSVSSGSAASCPWADVRRKDGMNLHGRTIGSCFSLDELHGGEGGGMFYERSNTEEKLRLRPRRCSVRQLKRPDPGPTPTPSPRRLPFFPLLPPIPFSLYEVFFECQVVDTKMLPSRKAGRRNHSAVALISKSGYLWQRRHRTNFAMCDSAWYYRVTF